eukprot:12073083-Karenia_brevis.AAC.1
MREGWAVGSSGNAMPSAAMWPSQLPCAHQRTCIHYCDRLQCWHLRLREGWAVAATVQPSSARNFRIGSYNAAICVCGKDGQWQTCRYSSSV